MDSGLDRKGNYVFFTRGHYWIFIPIDPAKRGAMAASRAPGKPRRGVSGAEISDYSQGMQPDHSREVRRLSRIVIQRLGAFQDIFLYRDRAPAEIRLIFQIGPEGADLRDLRKQLGVDAGYLSRMLRSLEEQQLVTIAKRTGDGRQRRVELTPAGMAEFTKYDRLSDELAASIIAPLTPDERGRLVAALAETDRLMLLAGVDVRLEPPVSRDARRCVNQYFQELAARIEGGFDPALSDRVDPDDLMPPKGCVLLARIEGNPVGCGALQRVDETTGEMKRMWTAPSARRIGVARRILRRLEATARGWKLETVRVTINRNMSEVRAFLRAEGFREVEPFNAEPYADYWFEKAL